jgi:hypothetical protein
MTLSNTNKWGLFIWALIFLWALLSLSFDVIRFHMNASALQRLNMQAFTGIVDEVWNDTVNQDLNGRVRHTPDPVKLDIVHRSGRAYDTRNSSFPHLCEAKLREKGLWQDWAFAHQPTSRPPVIWLDPAPNCYKRLNGKCVFHFEWDWIFSFVLRRVPGIDPSQLIADAEFRTLSDGGIYIFSQNTWSWGKFHRLSKALCVCDSAATLIHISDEAGIETPAYSQWSLIVRNYFNKAVVDNPTWGRNVVVVPLGFATSFWMNAPGIHHVPSVRERNYSWVFYGDPHKSTRRRMQSAMKTVPGGFSYYTSGGFATEEMIAPYKVRDTLTHSIFCPSPMGFSNPDTFRFSEALEAGCFPITDAGNGPKGYFTEYFERYDPGGPAMDYIMEVPNVDAWADVPLRIEQAMMNMTELQARHSAMVAWWDQFKDRLSRDIANRLIRSKHRRDVANRLIESKHRSYRKRASCG